MVGYRKTPPEGSAEAHKIMNQYIRTNDEGKSELNYDLLDMGARVNFLQMVEGWATEIPDQDEFAEYQVEAMVKNELDYLYTDEGDEVIIDPATRQWIIDTIISKIS